MFPKPAADLRPNTYEFEVKPLIKATGFREYDARWWFGVPGHKTAPELNLVGVTALGMGIGTLLGEFGVKREVIVGHDYRAYSSSIKLALATGLMAAGCKVHDIGLAVTPMAYFAQFALDVPAVAQVTASHNENGWTGVKMGSRRPVTFGPEEITRLKEIVFAASYDLKGGGEYIFEDGFAEKYIADLTNRPKLKRRIKVVAACGNGTAGAFAERILTAIGAEVIPMDTGLDYTFPHYNPNPEDLEMLHAMSKRVLAEKAEVGLGFDGDGDRCGVIDNTGEEIFADKVGVMLSRDISALYPGSTFVVDVKSTGIYAIDPVLKKNNARTDYWKTGHSYIKRRVNELSAIAGFEKSGHYFFNKPIGRGYDDGFVSALAILDMLDRNPGKTMADLKEALPKTWGSPTMSAHCPDEVKYGIADKVKARFEAMKQKGEKVGGHAIVDLITVNGVRVVTDDGTWGLVRASSNKPELVVVIESPVSEARLKEMFGAVDAVLREHKQVGTYNQTI
ncbi:MAG TPA: phosphomannomutase/phosphoglucomutase [Bauldia sp.]|nr:phosphomannomutase/phosphoglucomutase [Bauldia sp.]